MRATLQQSIAGTGWGMELRTASECARKKRAARAGVSAEPVSNLIRGGLESTSKGNRNPIPGRAGSEGRRAGSEGVGGGGRGVGGWGAGGGGGWGGGGGGAGGG